MQLISGWHVGVSPSMGVVVSFPEAGTVSRVTCMQLWLHLLKFWVADGEKIMSSEPRGSSTLLCTLQTLLSRHSNARTHHGTTVIVSIKQNKNHAKECNTPVGSTWKESKEPSKQGWQCETLTQRQVGALG